MITREILKIEKGEYNKVAIHPCQSWEWGEFRKKSGAEVIRIGVFKKEKLVSGYQLTMHSIPHTTYKIGYLPRGPMIDEEMIATLEKIGREQNCIFFRLEPNIIKIPNTPGLAEARQRAGKYQIPNILLPSSRPFFHKYTFLIDLTKSEDELLKQMRQKTRYNLKLAQKHGVKIVEDSSEKTFEAYLHLLEETTVRQRFYAHTTGYHRKMWEILKPAGIARLLKAEYQGEILAAWILFKFHEVLYYPYGASSSLYRRVMANNLMMWEAMKLGKKLGCKVFDLWGCLGPNPDFKNSWYGFHRFKEGYGGKLIELIGSFDLPLDLTRYRLYNFADDFRWKFLKLKSSFHEPVDAIKKFLRF